MPKLSRPLIVAALCAGAPIAAGSAATPSTTRPMPAAQTRIAPLAPDFRAPFEPSPFAGIDASVPALIAAGGNGATHLEYWPIDPKGGRAPKRLPSPHGLGQVGGMAANGSRLAIANGDEIVLYDLATQAVMRLPDPDGYPDDVAIDRHGAIYAPNILANDQNVVMYVPPATTPVELVCKYQETAEAIAVDNEGDIFVQQEGGFTGVFEIPNGPNGPDPTHCMKLHLKGGQGYVGGIAIDPKTDDLVVLDDPDLCAGGIEGRMTIYSKPYDAKTGRSHVLDANCAGTLRLDATSSIVFVGDESVSGGYSFVLQATYPQGRRLGTYHGGNPGALTTIPNTLPN